MPINICIKLKIHSGTNYKVDLIKFEHHISRANYSNEDPEYHNYQVNLSKRIVKRLFQTTLTSTPMLRDLAQPHQLASITLINIIKIDFHVTKALTTEICSLLVSWYGIQLYRVLINK